MLLKHTILALLQLLLSNSILSWKDPSANSVAYREKVPPYNIFLSSTKKKIVISDKLPAEADLTRL